MRNVVIATIAAVIVGLLIGYYFLGSKTVLPGSNPTGKELGNQVPGGPGNQVPGGK